MAPLVSLAISLLPDLAKRMVDNVVPEVEKKVTSVVRDVLGTDDPQRAEDLIADPKVAARLRVRLAEIDAEAAAREAEARQREREAEIEKLRVEIDGFKRQMADTENARSMLGDLSERGSVFAWGPVVVSTIVVLGFFAVLMLMMFYIDEIGRVAGEQSALVMQIVNIAVGALTAAFATVVSFWLGSSQGSRFKDATALRAQSVTASLQRESTASTREIVAEQTRQTAEIIKKVTQPQVAAGPSAPPAKSTRQFAHCMDMIFLHEGGYADHPEDPGGATKHGITHKTLASWRGVDRCTREEVKALSREEALEIYRAHYWNALNCDRLPVGVDLVVFDFGVNAGVGRSSRLLQQVVAVEADGEVGPITVGAAQATDPEFVINDFSDRRLDYYKRLPTWNTFGRGWSRRTSETRQRRSRCSATGRAEPPQVSPGSRRARRSPATRPARRAGPTAASSWREPCRAAAARP
jgi:lysozyme family protein